MCICLRVKYPLFLSVFNEIRIFLTYIRKILTSNFMRIRRVKAELFHEERRTDVQTDLTKVKVALSNFSNAHKKTKEFDSDSYLEKGVS